MEQQLAPKLPLWQDQDGEDDDEEDVGVSLLSRHSRHSTTGNGNTLTAAAAAATTTTTSFTGGELESAPVDPAPTNGTTTSEHADQEAATADASRRNGEVGDENEEDKVVKREGDGLGLNVYFDKLQGIESSNGVSEMLTEIPKILKSETNHQLVRNVEDQNAFGLCLAPFEQLHEETNTSFKRLTEADVSVDLIEEIEDLMDLDVERVLQKQNTHDLYCPNCNSCITGRVILRRRKPKVSNIRRKPKRVKKLDPIPSSEAKGRSGDTSEIDSNVNPIAPPDEQTEQEQEAFSCLSCFSIFIPIGNGCFKIFQFFGYGRKNEHARSPQEIIQRENKESPQDINTSENRQSPQEISQEEKAQSTPGKNLNETAETSQKEGHNEHTISASYITANEGAQSPQKSSHDENMDGAPHISHHEDAQSPEHVSSNEDTQSPPKISSNENTQSPNISLNAQSPQNLNQNENKQSPQTIPTAKTNWNFSFFRFRKGKETVEKAQTDHASSVQSATVPTLSVTIGECIDGAAIKPKEPGISNIFSSTDRSLLDKVKAASREKKPDADMLRRNVVEDIEAGLLEPTFSPKTEVESSSQSKTQNEHGSPDAGEANEWEILKSIVYGGLIESITSLGVVSSAAGAGADTLNVLALGIANLIGGLLVISHNLRELKNDQPRGASTGINAEKDRYQALLGRRRHFVLHVTVAIMSFLIFGLIPPVVYGFSFRKSDDKDLKLAAVAGASLVCIFLLALGKGHVTKPHRTYFKAVSYYVFLGITTSGISFVVGELIKRLLEKLGLFDSTSAVSMPFFDTVPLEVGRASY
ncbi:hypothetical protein PTKIN_Ptkin05aG0084600 [Pterospermum kingtungense]